MAYICAQCRRGRKRLLDSQELELRSVVNRQVDPESRTLVLCKNST